MQDWETDKWKEGNKPTKHRATKLLMKHRWAGGKNTKTGSVKQNTIHEVIPFQQKMKYETKTQDHNKSQFTV